MKPRIPLAYAGLLVTALMAVVGFAAFSPSTSSLTEGPATTVSAQAVPNVSARVASAVLALRVTESDARVATTAPEAQTEEATQTAPESTTTTTAPESTTTTHADASDEPAVEASPETATIQAAPTTTTTKPRDTTPPPLKVTSPHDGDTVTSRIVTFTGTSEPGARVTSGPYEATMSDNGDWTIKLAVIEGSNGASFTATDKAGNTESTRIVVIYEAAASTPTTTRPATTTTTTKAPHAETVTTTTKAPHAETVTTTTAPHAETVTTTTKASSTSKWSPKWPADAGGIRSVEKWRSTVEKYWPASRVDCALGIIQRESKGDPRAFNSSSSAEGLMQHLSKYWVSRAKGAGFIDGSGLVASPFNGAANIAAGAYLANYYDGATGQWWNPWKSGSGGFTAQYGSCTSSNPG